MEFRIFFLLRPSGQFELIFKFKDPNLVKYSLRKVFTENQLTVQFKDSYLVKFFSIHWNFSEFKSAAHETIYFASLRIRT